MKLFNSIKINKSILFILMFLIGSLIIFPSIFYLRNYYHHYGMIAIGIFWFLITIFVVFEFRIIGVIISFLFLFLISMFFTIIKIFIIKEDWTFYISTNIILVLCFSIVINNTKKIKKIISKGHDIEKAYEQSFQQNIKTNFDLIILMIIPFISQFILGNNKTIMISTIFLTCLILNYLINLFLKQLIINLLIKTKLINNKKIFNFNPKKIKIFKNELNLTIFGKYLLILVLHSILTLIILAIIFKTMKFNIINNYSESFYFKNLLLVWLTSTFLGLFYLIFRYGWTYSLTICINIFISGIFIILFVALTNIKISDDVLMAIPIGISIIFKSNVEKYSEIKMIYNDHANNLEKKALLKTYNSIDRKMIFKDLFYSFFISFFLIFTLLFTKEFWLITTLIISIFTFWIIHLFLSQYLWIKLELFKINFLNKRHKNNYWDFQDNEEQVIKGINDFKI